MTVDKMSLDEMSADKMPCYPNPCILEIAMNLLLIYDRKIHRQCTSTRLYIHSQPAVRTINAEIVIFMI